MKKKKGFTLIELLAVIVILAIIALIATPIVMNVIENARKGAAERSAENYVRAVETAIMTNRTSGTIISDGVYAHGAISGVETSGETPTAASIIVKDGQVMDGSTITMNGYVVNIIDGVGKVGDFGTVVDDIAGQTTTIKFDPVANDSCSSGDTCYDWYVLEDKGAEYATVSLIMNKNIGDVVSWGNTGDTTPTIALPYLKSQTNNWVVNVSLPTYATIINILPKGYDENISWLTSNLTGSQAYWLQERSTYPMGSCANSVKLYDNNGANINIMSSVTSQLYIRPVITIPKSKLQNS